MAKILVVDDNLASCEMLSDVLTQWGYDVRQAHQGKEVLPLVEEFAPDLVLLDVMLPGMNGFEICKRIKASPKTENIAVILLTVLNDVEDRTQGIRVGADLFLSKPVNYKELRRQIEFVLSNKTHIAELEESAAVCECFLRFMRCLDPVLYRHSLQVQGYAKKLAMRLELSDQSIARAQIGAALHDVEKLLPEQEGDGERALEIFAPLKMMEWLRPICCWKSRRRWKYRPSGSPMSSASSATRAWKRNGRWSFWASSIGRSARNCMRLLPS